MMKPERVEIGQRWRDRDSRTKGNGEFVVTDVLPVTMIHRQNGPHEVEVAFVRRDTGHRTRIATSRLLADNSNRGYEYLGRGK